VRYPYFREKSLKQLACILIKLSLFVVTVIELASSQSTYDIIQEVIETDGVYTA